MAVRSDSRSWRFSVLVGALVLSSGLVASCGGGGPPSGEVVLYTSMPDSVVDRLKGVIEERFPDMDGNLWVTLGDGITLTVVRGRTADLEARIAAEVDAGGIQADLIWLAEPSAYEGFKADGLLAPLQPPADAPIPSRHIDPDGFYVAGRIISMVVAWNSSLVPEGLTDWPDLQRVERAAFPAPESGAARATIRALIDEFGEEFFATLAGTGGVSVRSNGAARDGLVAGSHDAVGVLDYMARGAKAGGAAIDFAYPASGTVLIPSPIAIPTSAANPDAAEVVVEFLLSAAGQKIMVEIGSFYPVRTDVSPPAGAPPLSSIQVLDVDWMTLGSDVSSIEALWEGLYGAAVETG